MGFKNMANNQDDADDDDCDMDAEIGEENLAVNRVENA